MDMLYNERQLLILSILKRKKVMKTSDLQTQTFSTQSTLRRDLLELEKSGVIAKQHGWVQYIPETNIEFSSNYRETKDVDEKKIIAKLATILLTDGMSLFLDSSTTVQHLLPHLVQYRNLVVITNNYKIGAFISNLPNITGFLIGGKIKKNSSSVIGNLTYQFINEFKPDLTFFSCRGIDNNGVYEADEEQALVKKQMIANSQKSALLIDNSKFSKSHFYRLSDLSNIDYIITNQKPEDEVIEIFEKKQCEIIC